MVALKQYQMYIIMSVFLVHLEHIKNLNKMNCEPFVRNTLILNSLGFIWSKMTIIFVPIRPSRRNEELDELEETEEQ